jgi:hypothetical protein
LIVVSGMGFALAGVLVGILAALALTQLMSGVLSDVTSNDPLTYLAVAAMLGTEAFLASYLPARDTRRPACCSAHRLNPPSRHLVAPSCLGEMPLRKVWVVGVPVAWSDEPPADPQQSALEISTATRM